MILFDKEREIVIADYIDHVVARNHCGERIDPQNWELVGYGEVRELRRDQ